MTTTSALDNVRANLIARGFPAEEVDEMLNLTGRMILEGSLASKDDVEQLRGEFTLFKIDVAERFAELRGEMIAGFAELRGEMDAGFAELRGEMDAKFAELRGEMDAKFAELRGEMDAKFAELRGEMNARFAEQDAKNADRENRILRWVFGGVIAGIAINAAIVSVGVAVIAQMV